MPQISLFEGFGADPALKPKSLKSKSQPKSVANRIESVVTGSAKIQPKTPDTRAKWGYCQGCGDEIAIPGLNASLCSNPICTCGSSGWFTNFQDSKGGQPND